MFEGTSKSLKNPENGDRWLGIKDYERVMTSQLKEKLQADYDREVKRAGV
ncbi:hypothetical protein P4S72_01230 [Vibrio sp. PP-XX7]